MPPRARNRERQQRNADADGDDDARHRPAGDLGGDEHVENEQDDGDDVEDAVCDDCPDERRPEPAAPGELPVQNRDARELADASGQHRVGEQTDGEGGEDEHEAGTGWRHRGADHGPPRECAHDDGRKVDADRDSDPLPLDGRECIGDPAQARTTPQQEPNDPGGEQGDEGRAPPLAPREAEPLHPAAAMPTCGRPATPS